MVSHYQTFRPMKVRGDGCIFPNVTEKCRLVTGFFNTLLIDEFLRTVKTEEKHTPFQQSDVTAMSRYYISITTV